MCTRAVRGKRGRPDVAAFELRLEENLLRLETDLLEESYRPGGYPSFYAHEPKRRLVSAAPFRDRVVVRSVPHPAVASRLKGPTHQGANHAPAWIADDQVALTCGRMLR